MNTSLAQPNTSKLTSLSALTRWTVGTLVTNIVLMIYLQVVIVGGFSPPLALIFGVPAVFFAIAVLLIRWRWAPLLSVLYWIFLLALSVRSIRYDLSHPESYNPFAVTLLVVALSLVGIVSGASATIQNYRPLSSTELEHARSRVPRWFRPLPWAVAGLCLGALLVGAIPRVSAGAAVSAETLAALPALTADQGRFAPTELRAQTGALVALRLENRDANAHTFNIDELNVHLSMPPGEPRLALFRAGPPGVYTFYCDVPGHRQAGMVGSLIITS
jgi:plastocyanin